MLASCALGMEETFDWPEGSNVVEIMVSNSLLQSALPHLQTFKHGR
jgi:hypothetical protein